MLHANTFSPTIDNKLNNGNYVNSLYFDTVNIL